MWAMIGTWRMSKEAIENVSKKLNQKTIDASKAVVESISEIEDFPYFKSVGYGGLPNEEMVVELDAGFMNGDNYSLGAIMAIKDYANPIKIAYELSKNDTNCVLVASGAEKFAHKNGFERKNMLSDRAIIHYKKRVQQEAQELKAYAGHDTVGICALDNSGSIAVGTSTSGLFMKKAGRVGDSPLIGSGFYADSSVGACTATGLGEDLMKGCISYEVVSLIEKGLHPQQACEQALNKLHTKLMKLRGKVGDLSIVAIDKQGNYGCATNIDNFSFVYASENQSATVYLVKNIDGKTTFEVASEKWLDDYLKKRMEPLTL